MNRMLFIPLMVFLFGCSLLEHKELPDVNVNETYRFDLQMKVNGQECVGTCVVKPAQWYEIEVKPPGKIDRIMWRTCSQEQVVDKPDSGWFSNKFEFKVTHAAGFEDVSACGTVEVTVLEEKKRRNGFGLITFKDLRPEVSLMAKINCNGKSYFDDGVISCQSAAGLIQRLSFQEPVIQEGAAPGCAIMQKLDDTEKNWQFIMPKGECIYYFVANSRASNGKRKVLRLQTIGYTDVPPIKL